MYKLLRKFIASIENFEMDLFRAKGKFNKLFVAILKAWLYSKLLYCKLLECAK